MNLKKLLYILIMCSSLSACDKLPANGDLDGMWKVVKIEHNGKELPIVSDQVCMSIQLKLFMLDEYKHTRKYFGYFEHKGDSIKFWNFSYESRNENESQNNFPIEEKDKSILEPWGFYSLNEAFKVEKLTKDILIIKNDSTQISYIKF